MTLLVVTASPIGAQCVHDGVNSFTCSGNSDGTTISGSIAAETVTIANGAQFGNSAVNASGGDDLIVNNGTVSGTTGLNGDDDNDTLTNNGALLDTSTMNGGAGDDTLTNNGTMSDGSSMNGGDDDDLLINTTDNGARLNGDNGNDTLIGGSGDDSLMGGTGIDLFDSGSSTTDMVVDLVAGTATGQGTDSLNAIENIVTGSGDDSVTGDSNDNLIDGGDGNDTLLGGDGNDTLLGGSGNDSLSGGIGDDSIEADGGRDSVEGGEGSDTVRVSGEHDGSSISGGSGSNVIQIANGTFGKLTLNSTGEGDTLDFSLFGFAITIDLSSQSEQTVSTGANVDTDEDDLKLTLVGVFQYFIGTSGNDSITTSGTSLETQIDAGNGDDTIVNYGTAGLLLGGDGNDVIENYGTVGLIHGNYGNDFILLAANSESVGDISGGDGEDTIRLEQGAEVGGPIYGDHPSTDPGDVLEFYLGLNGEDARTLQNYLRTSTDQSEGSVVLDGRTYIWTQFEDIYNDDQLPWEEPQPSAESSTPVDEGIAALNGQNPAAPVALFCGPDGGLLVYDVQDGGLGVFALATELTPAALSFPVSAALDPGQVVVHWVNGQVQVTVIPDPFSTTQPYIFTFDAGLCAVSA